ncbi:MAG: peptide chain release factor-like protein [Verrucomicrobiota bacterium]
MFLSQLKEEDLVETFSRSSGPGGQNVNKVETRVQLTHQPSGITVTVQDSRSREKNRTIARERLLQRINEKRETARKEKRHEREKQLRRSRPRPKGVKERILKAKKNRSAIKSMRQKPDF